MSSENKTLVIWAVDPVPGDKKLQFKTVQALQKFTKSGSFIIEPVAVLSADRLKVPSESFGARGDEYQMGAEALLKKWAKDLKMPSLAPPRVLQHGIHSDTNAVATLLEHARKQGAVLIALGTHTRKKIERFFMGSFAESVILKSDIPLLVVNPRKPVRPKISRILFSTDFGEASHKAFQTILPSAKNLKAHLTLYFKFEYIVPHTIEAMTFTPLYSDYLIADRKIRKGVATRWIEEATKQGVKADFVLDEKASYIPDGILKAAKKSKADIIAMVSRTGPIAASFTGSITRQVVRTSEVPVWVVHP